MHNRIEHNASLIHKDAMDGEEYAPLKADPKLIEQMLDDARDGGFSIRDFARARVRREESPDPDIDAYHAKIALGEAGLAFLLFKDKNNKMPMASFKNWFIHERFPENWVATRERTLAEVLVIAKDMDAEMHKIRAAHQKPQVTRWSLGGRKGLPKVVRRKIWERIRGWFEISQYPWRPSLIVCVSNGESEGIPIDCI